MSNFISDEPISDESEDELDRGAFIAHLANSICEWNGKESIAIGLCGAWGEGKTSIINLTRKKISKKNTKIKFVDFQPWMLSESDNLVESFLTELSKTVNKKKFVFRKYARLLSRIPSMKDIKTILNTILFHTSWIGISAAGILDFIANASFLKYFAPVAVILFIFKEKILPHIAHPQSISEVKNEVKKILESSKNKFLIIIDDIDRLSTQEIRQVFRIIRTNADFPNTIYLLSFDRDVVEKSLGVQEEIPGSKYLEKMIQASFALPPVPANKVFDYLLRELKKLRNEYPVLETYFKDISYAKQIHHPGFKSFFTNIRDVKRFINSYHFNISLVIDEDTINPVDFMGIDAFRLFEPQFYYFLMNNKGLFIEYSSKTNFLYNPFGYPSDKEADFIQEERKEGYNLIKSSRTEKISLLGVLFPQITGITPSVKDSLMKNRICQPDKFDSYFTPTPNKTEIITKFDIKRFFDSSNDYDKLSLLINELEMEGRFLPLIQMLHNFFDDQEYFMKTNYENIIQALLDSFASIEIKRGFALFESTDYQIVLLIHALLTDKADYGFNYAILKNVVKNVKVLCGLIFFIKIEAGEYKKEDRTTWEKIVDDADLDNIILLCINRINENKKKIINEKLLPFILDFWKKWGDIKDYEEYLNNIWEDDSSFLRFFVQFAFAGGRFLDHDSIKEHQPTIFNYKEFNDFYHDEESVKRKIEEIKTADSEHYNHYKNVIDYYLEHYENRNSVF